MVNLLEPLTTEQRQIFKEEVNKFGPIHWLFLFFIVLPCALIATPFALMGLVSQLILAFIAWLGRKLPDYTEKQP